MLKTDEEWTDEEWFERWTEKGYIASTGYDYGFWPNGMTGYFDSRMLRAIADHLDKINQPIYDGYEEYCRRQDIEEGVYDDNE